MTHDATNASGHAADVLKNPAGSIAVYRGKARRTGIDACVPMEVAVAMLKIISDEGEQANGLYLCQPEVGGMAAVDVELPAPVAAQLLSLAKRAGVSIRA